MHECLFGFSQDSQIPTIRALLSSTFLRKSTRCGPIEWALEWQTRKWLEESAAIVDRRDFAVNYATQNGARSFVVGCMVCVSKISRATVWAFKGNSARAVLRCTKISFVSACTLTAARGARAWFRDMIELMALKTLQHRYEAFHVNCPSARHASPKSCYF